jgi:outer membrane protein OmpA-like peptidoglycan-associated protein
MKNNLPIICLGAGLGAMILATAGCATKSYVQKSIDPVNGKMDSQGQQIAQTSQSLQKTQQSLDADETKLSATDERATAADARAGDAIAKAGEASNKADDAANKADRANLAADKVGHDLGDLKTEFANLDDYRKVSSATVNFKLDSDKLDSDAKKQLDRMVSGNNYKRYFIAVEGFTDKTGSDAYNQALSRRRADAVVAYLVSQHDIPVYRIQMIGLGKDKPVDEGKDRTARAKNRRVEVTVFSADQGSGPIAMNN